MKPFASLLTAALLAAAPEALAQSPYRTRLLAPGAFDVRVGLEADALLNHAGGQLSTEVGLFPLGDGVLAAGLEGSFSRCLLGCGSGGGLLVDRSALSPLVRVSWHFPVGGETANVSEVGLYALALGGASFTFQSAENGGLSVERSQVVPVVGGGIGSVYFPGNGNVVFAGGELRVLYAPPTREAAAAGAALSAWSLAGVRLAFTIGARL